MRDCLRNFNTALSPLLLAIAVYDAVRGYPWLLAYAFVHVAIVAALWLAPGLRYPAPAARPAVIERKPAGSRTGLDPKSPANAALLATCPVCGMDDPERFRTGIGVALWNGWPAHESCAEWLGDAPEPARWPLNIPPAGTGTAASVIKAPAPRDVMSQFPHITAADVAQARDTQRHGDPILVTAAQAGTMKLLVLGCPDWPRLIRIGGEDACVNGHGPLGGGYWLLMLADPLRQDHAAGTLITVLSRG